MVSVQELRVDGKGVQGICIQRWVEATGPLGPENGDLRFGGSVPGAHPKAQQLRGEGSVEGAHVLLALQCAAYGISSLCAQLTHHAATCHLHQELCQFYSFAIFFLEPHTRSGPLLCLLP